MESINLLVVHSRPLIVAGIHSLVDRLAHWQVVADTANAHSALQYLRRGRVDVVLVEHNLPGVSGLSLAGVMRRANHALSIGIIGELSAVDAAIALAHGVGLFIHTQITSRDLHLLAQRLRKHHADQPNFYHPITTYEHLLEHTPIPAEPIPQTNKTLLSSREHDVLAQLCRGATNGDIADTLHISVHTVKQHVANMLVKCRVPDRRSLAAYAVRMGWIDANDAAILED